MKSKRLPKLLAALASLLMIVVAVVCVTAFAGEDDPATIKKINISYDGAVRIVYEVERNSTDVEPVILVWEDDVTGDKTVENASYQIKDYGIYQYGEDYVGTKFDGVYFLSNGFAPKDLKRPISAAVAVEKDGALVFNNKEIATLSIFDYVIKRFENTTATTDQKALYTSLLNYGGAVQAVLYEGYLNDGKTEAEAAELAGLKYGYADAYVGVRYYETAMVKGEAKNSTPTVNYYRAADDIFVEAPVTYMGRPFAGFVDKNGEQFVGSTASRYTTVNVDEPSITDVVATYKRATGTAEVPATTIDKFTLDRNYSSTVTVTALPGGGIAFDKPVKTQDLDGKTGNSNPSVSITPTNTARTDDWYIAADADISFPKIYDGCTVDGFAYVLFSAGAYGYRLNIQRTASNIVTFSTALENRYTPRFVIKGGFDADGISNGNEKILKTTTIDKITYHGSIYTRPVQGENDGFADKSIHLDDLKNIRIEMHPENEKLVDYNYIVVIDADGDVTTTEDRTAPETRTAQVYMPEVRLYVNGEYWGSTYYANFNSNNADIRNVFTYTIYEDATDDYFVTPYHKARTENAKLSLGKFTTTFMGAGIANIHLNNVTYGTYDYEDRFYDAPADLDADYANVDYGNKNHMKPATNGDEKAETVVYKGADGKFSYSETEGAEKFTVNWVKGRSSNVLEDSYSFGKHVTVTSVLDKNGNDLLANGGTFEGLKAGDVIPKLWLNVDKSDQTWWGNGNTLTNYVAEKFYELGRENINFVYESDITIDTSELSAPIDWMSFQLKNASGKTVFELYARMGTDGTIYLKERYKNTGDTTLTEIAIGKKGEKIHLKFDAYINSITDNSQNYIDVYVNNVRALRGNSFTAECFDATGVSYLAMYMPSTSRDVKITLENTRSHQTYPIAKTENEVVYDWDADKTIANDYPGISANGNVNIDKTPATATKGYLYLDTFNGEDVLHYGTVEKTGEKHVYLELPENDSPFNRVVFSTKLWISSGMSGNKDDFLRFVLADKKAGKKGDGGVNQIVFNPAVATTGEKVNYVLSGPNQNADKAILEQDKWNTVTIEYDVTTKKTNVYVNGVWVMKLADRQNGFTSIDVNFIAIELRGSSGNLKNIDVMFKDTMVGYTKNKETVTAEKVVDYTNAADLYSVQYNNIASDKLATAGFTHLVGTLYGKDNAYTMSWKYNKDEVESKNADASTLLFYFNNGSETNDAPTNTPYSKPAENVKYVFETDICYSPWVFNDKTTLTAGVVTSENPKYYNSWISYFNICDVREGVDGNALGTVNASYNSKTKKLTLHQTEIEFNKWYHIRVEFTYNDTAKTWSWTFYLDNVELKTETSNATNSAKVADAVLGFRIKNKSAAYFSEGGMSVANTTFTEYKIGD